MRLLGLDVGSKTVGVAESDPLGWTAQGVRSSRSMKKRKSLASSGWPNWSRPARWLALSSAYLRT